MLLLHAPMYTGIATSIPSIPVYTKYELAVDLKRNGKNKINLFWQSPGRIHIFSS